MVYLNLYYMYKIQLSDCIVRVAVASVVERTQLAYCDVGQTVSDVKLVKRQSMFKKIMSQSDVHLSYVPLFGCIFIDVSRRYIHTLGCYLFLVCMLDGCFAVK